MFRKLARRSSLCWACLVVERKTDYPFNAQHLAADVVTIVFDLITSNVFFNFLQQLLLKIEV